MCNCTICLAASIKQKCTTDMQFKIYYNYYFIKKVFFLLTPSCLHSLVLGLTGLGPVSVQLTLPTFLLGVVKPGAAISILQFILENGQNKKSLPCIFEGKPWIF